MADITLTDNLEKTIGKILDVEFKSYYKFEFSLVFKVEKDGVVYHVRATTGGESDLIYRYNPMSTDWSEHLAADIKNIIAIP